MWMFIPFHVSLYDDSLSFHEQDGNRNVVLSERRRAQQGGPYELKLDTHNNSAYCMSANSGICSMK